jgi:hypothetical protein
MRRMHFVIALVCLLLCGGIARAQNPKGARPSNGQVVVFIIQFQEKQVLGVAEAMPAEKYGFAPTNGEFQGVRTFAEELKHIAADLYLDGASILGENPPGDLQPGENGSSAAGTESRGSAPMKPQAADEQRPIGEELESWINKTAELLVPAADAMPEEKYSFAPSAGEFHGVRTFAGQVKHSRRRITFSPRRRWARNLRTERCTRLRRIPCARKRRSWNTCGTRSLICSALRQASRPRTARR